MKNFVILKGRRDRIEIKLDEFIDFDTLKLNLTEKIIDAKNLLGNSAQVIEFSGRKISEKEEKELISIINDNSNVTVKFLISSQEEKPKFIYDISPNCNMTKYHIGNLRAGSTLEFDGSLVIIGDVNPGAIVKVSQNLIVIGRLNGTVYAGLENKNNNYFIGAMYFNPVQLTIGNVTATGLQKKVLDTNRFSKDKKFKFAKLELNRIIIEDNI